MTPLHIAAQALLHRLERQGGILGLMLDSDFRVEVHALREALAEYAYEGPPCACPLGVCYGYDRPECQWGPDDAVQRIQELSRSIHDQLATLGSRDHASLDPARYALAQRAITALAERAGCQSFPSAGSGLLPKREGQIDKEPAGGSGSGSA